MNVENSKRQKIGTVEGAFGAEDHKKSDELSFFAEKKLRAGKTDEAQRMYSEAAELEFTHAAQICPLLRSGQVKTLFAVSSVSLFLKAGRKERAEEVAGFFLSEAERLPHEGRVAVWELIEKSPAPQG